MPAPYFPGSYYPVTNNQDNVTTIDKAYMDERDKEIRQIELALGQNLVPSTAYPLVTYLRVGGTAPNYQLLLVPSVIGSNVGVGTTNPTARLQVNRETSALGDAIKLYKTSDVDQAWLSWSQGFETSGYWRLGFTKRRAAAGRGSCLQHDRHCCREN